MAREKKPKVVQTVEHRSGRKVDILLHPDTLVFSAQVVDGVTFEKNSAIEVRLQVVEYLDKNSKIEWQPIIETSEQKPFAASDYAFIGITPLSALRLYRHYAGSVLSWPGRGG